VAILASSGKQDRQSMYNVTLWHFLVANVAVEMRQCSLCVAERHITVSNITRYLNQNAFMLNLCPLRHLNILRPSRKSSPITGLEWPRGFQEVKVPRFLDNGTGRW